MESEQAHIRELPAGETHLAHDAMSALRPSFEDEARFVGYVDGVLRPGGYRLAAVFEPGEGRPAVAAAGFRIADSLAWGHHLYVDDLSSVPGSRRRGYARMLLDWLVEEGRRQRCAQMHLTSIVGSTRFDAHRLYYNAGLGIYAHHFTREL
jgi:GNAT superfamily N-acetyltransferase